MSVDVSHINKYITRSRCKIKINGRRVPIFNLLSIVTSNWREAHDRREPKRRSPSRHSGSMGFRRIYQARPTFRISAHPDNTRCIQDVLNAARARENQIFPVASRQLPNILRARARSLASLGFRWLAVAVATMVDHKTSLWRRNRIERERFLPGSRPLGERCE